MGISKRRIGSPRSIEDSTEMKEYCVVENRFALREWWRRIRMEASFCDHVRGEVFGTGHLKSTGQFSEPLRRRRQIAAHSSRMPRMECGFPSPTGKRRTLARTRPNQRPRKLPREEWTILLRGGSKSLVNLIKGDNTCDVNRHEARMRATQEIFQRWWFSGTAHTVSKSSDFVEHVIIEHNRSSDTLATKASDGIRLIWVSHEISKYSSERQSLLEQKQEQKWVG